MISKYSQLDDSGKSTFLQIVTNTLLVVFTFWLGLSLQFLINDNNKKNTELITKAQFIDIFLPAKTQVMTLMRDHLTFTFGSDLELYRNNNNDTTFREIGKRFLNASTNEKASYISSTDTILNICAKVKYYLPAKKYTEFQDNLNYCIIYNWFFKQYYLDEVKDETTIKEQFGKFCSNHDLVLVSDLFFFRNKTIDDTLDEVIKEINRQNTNKGEEYACGDCMNQINKYLCDFSKELETIVKTDEHNIFWFENPWQNSLVLLFLFIIVAIYFTRFIMKKALSAHASVSRSEYNSSKRRIDELDKECKHLSTELEQYKLISRINKSIVNDESYIIPQMQEKYNILEDKYLDTLGEIKQLKEKIIFLQTERDPDEI